MVGAVARSWVAGESEPRSVMSAPRCRFGDREQAAVQGRQDLNDYPGFVALAREVRGWVALSVRRFPIGTGVPSTSNTRPRNTSGSRQSWVGAGRGVL
jgi:hypothetical protein